jgi:NitT/TauT family transport system permease protein
VTFLRRASLGAAGIVGVAAAAQLALWAGRVDPTLFPPPSTVLAQVVELLANGSFTASVGSTLAVWAEAMAITVVIAVPAGIVLGMLPAAESALRPVIEFLRPIPSVVILPLVLLIVQDNVRAEIVVIVFAALWPVLINTVYGFREVDPVAKETLRSFGFGPLAVACRVSLPSAAPFIATGVRIAASLAFVVAVAVELIGAGMNGVGGFVSNSEAVPDYMAVISAVAVWSGLIGLALNGIFVAAERRAFRWRHALAGTSEPPR